LGVRRASYSIFFAWIAAAATFAPTASHTADPAQKVARVAFVDPFSSSPAVPGSPAFWEHLQELGWVQGKNLVTENRWAEGQIDRLPTLMADVVTQRVDVIVTRSTPAAMAAKNATTTIPIVVASMGDPVGTGLVASLGHPGGNLTGLSLEQTADLSGKWLELLQETVPRLTTVAVISNPDSAYVKKAAKDLEAPALARGVKLRFVNVREPAALTSAVRQARRQAQAALVLSDPLTVSHRREIARLAAANRLPTIYVILEFMDSGGLMAYGADPTTLWRRAAEYVDKILRGAKPADLPIEQPTQFKLIVNLKAAQALGLTFPESILLRADEVIR
jgi:putative ABC transport system substrate-binding protein